MKTHAQIQQDVRDELEWEPSVNATDIGVHVEDRIVTINGYVDSNTQKWAAERAVQCVAGVAGLAVEMEVRLPHGNERTDGDIARTAENMLSWSNSLGTK